MLIHVNVLLDLMEVTVKLVSIDLFFKTNGIILLWSLVLHFTFMWLMNTIPRALLFATSFHLRLCQSTAHLQSTGCAKVGLT